MAPDTRRLRRSPIQHAVMFSQCRVVIIHHCHRAMITGIGSGIERAKTKDAFFQGYIRSVIVPGNECLAVAAINPGAFGGEVIAECVRVRTFAADHCSAGTRHGKVCLVFEAMNFDDVS